MQGVVAAGKSEGTERGTACAMPNEDGILNMMETKSQGGTRCEEEEKERERGKKRKLEKDCIPSFLQHVGPHIDGEVANCRLVCTGITMN